MLQRPRFHSFTDNSHIPTEKHSFSQLEYSKEQYQSNNLVLPVGLITSDHMDANNTLNRKTSKIRRLSAILNKKFNRNRLSREQISPPVLVTSSSFIQTTPIQKPAKELVNTEKSMSSFTPYIPTYNQAHAARLSAQLSRQSSKSSTHTTQSQLSERDNSRLDLHNQMRHHGFLSGGSLSSFTSSGSSDKHSSVGTYNREKYMTSTYTGSSGNDWEERSSQIVDTRPQSFDQQRAGLEKARTHSIEGVLSPISPSMTKWEEAALSQREMPTSHEYTMMRNTSPSYRFSGSSCYPNSAKWSDVRSHERAMSDYGTYNFEIHTPPNDYARHVTSADPVKSRWREAAIYAKDLEDYADVLSELETTQNNIPTYPEEASVLEFLASLSPSSTGSSLTSTDSIVEKEIRFETRNINEVILEVDEENDEQSIIFSDDHLSIFDLYDYESDVDDQAEENVLAQYGTDDQESITSYTSLTDLIEQLNRISMTMSS
ncbi:hypothetical protein K7432_003245 [Basidiobolus ranarum]|uniref:Uncharacterized protein n=1 Tax=Basidiobolus ranarum TaxID=34480 RepID=A0ABR2W6H6_9FUNG